jgi:hypothetical protein
VRDAILIGIVLAAIVLFVFLRNMKVTLIAIMVVPAVLASTVVLLGVLGMSFNIMTLGGMAAAVGLIIDDAIVMIEHIVRRLRGAETHSSDQVMRAAREFMPPLVGSPRCSSRFSSPGSPYPSSLTICSERRTPSRKKGGGSADGSRSDTRDCSAGCSAVRP